MFEHISALYKISVDANGSWHAFQYDGTFNAVLCAASCRDGALRQLIRWHPGRNVHAIQITPTGWLVEVRGTSDVAPTINVALTLSAKPKTVTPAPTEIISDTISEVDEVDEIFDLFDD